MLFRSPQIGVLLLASPSFLCVIWVCLKGPWIVIPSYQYLPLPVCGSPIAFPSTRATSLYRWLGLCFCRIFAKLGGYFFDRVDFHVGDFYIVEIPHYSEFISIHSFFLPRTNCMGLF